MPYIGKSPHFGVRNRFLFVADASDTSVSGADANGATLTFTDGAFVDVYLNGVLLKAGTDYNTNTANTIAGLSALSANDEVTVLVYDIFSVADTVSASSGGTFSGGVIVNGNVGIKTTTPTNYYADDLVVTAPDEGGITVVGGTTERNYLAFADGTSGDARYRGLISYDHNTDKLGIGAGGGTKIELDGNGIMTNATQPALIAHSNANNTVNFSSADTYEIVQFNIETIDKNADYASSQTFTAPVDGTYYANANVMRAASSSGSITYDLAIYVNSSLTLYTRNHGDNSGSNTITQNVTGLVDLDASDTLQVYARVSDTKGTRYASQTTTYFHVFLVA